MSDMKCPFCQQEYIITKDDSCFGQQRCVCRNPNCEFDGWHFPIKLVSELIRTRKALDIRKKQVEIANKAFDFISTEWDNADCSRKELGACAFNAKEDIAGWESDI